MKISLNWIKEFVEIPPELTPAKLAELLTLRTCEVEGFEEEGKGLEGVVVGEILEFAKHPDADKLNVAKVDIGRKQPLQIIFGQMVKMNVGDRIPVAVAPTKLPTGIEILARDMRGVRSEGMLCLEQELGFKESGVSILYFHDTKPGTPLAQALNKDDVIFEVDNKSLTHRPDLWGHHGMAREFAAFLEVQFKDLSTPAQPARVEIELRKKGKAVKVELVEDDLAARFLSVIISGVKIVPSPEWMQNRLLAVGMRPVNNIVDITNYVMLELGHPLHAFDRRVVGNDTFIIRRANPGEITTTLDHKKRELQQEDILVTNGETILAIAGVMGGENSEIKDDTTEIVLEVATWNPIAIRKTAQRHNLRSDAAARFEKSLDPEYAGFAFHRAVELILKLCPGARLAGKVTDLYPKKKEVRKLKTITLNCEKVCKKIGAYISEEEIINHLKALQFTPQKGKKGIIKVMVPTFRATKDILIEDDLIEEVARMHGYERIVPIIPSLPAKLPMENRQRVLESRIRNILSRELGFTETMHYSFYGKEQIEFWQLPEELHYEITNPLTVDQTHLRVNLIPHLVTAALMNFRARPHVMLYEIGRTYLKKPENYFPLEEKYIAAIVARAEGDTFYDLLGALHVVCREMHTSPMKLTVSRTPPPYAHPKACAEIWIQKTQIGLLYELNPTILARLRTQGSLSALEINFSRLALLADQPVLYKSLPRFPGTTFDVSVLVPFKTFISEVRDIIHAPNQPLITEVALLDIFRDPSLGTDKKSLTFRVTLQANDRTLTDEEMRAVQEITFRTLRSHGFTIRGI